MRQEYNIKELAQLKKIDRGMLRELSLPTAVLPGETASANNCSLPYDSSQGLSAHTNIYLGKQNTITGQTSEQVGMTASLSVS